MRDRQHQKIPQRRPRGLHRHLAIIPRSTREEIGSAMRPPNDSRPDQSDGAGAGERIVAPCHLRPLPTVIPVECARSRAFHQLRCHGWRARHDHTATRASPVSGNPLGNEMRPWKWVTKSKPMPVPEAATRIGQGAAESALRRGSALRVAGAHALARFQRGFHQSEYVLFGEPCRAPRNVPSPAAKALTAPAPCPTAQRARKYVDQCFHS